VADAVDVKSHSTDKETDQLPYNSGVPCWSIHTIYGAKKEKQCGLLRASSHFPALFS
jgi:hypothetical protein